MNFRFTSQRKSLLIFWSILYRFERYLRLYMSYDFSSVINNLIFTLKFINILMVSNNYI